MKQSSLKRDALLLGGYLAVLFGTTSFMPQLWFWAASRLGVWHRLLPEGIGVCLILLLLGTLLRQGLRHPFLQGTFLLCLIFLFFISMGQVRRPIEKIHFSEYGFLSLLLFRLIRHGVRSRGCYGWTLLGVCLIGFLDELLQGLLPNRVYDPRDIGMNGLAGAIGLVAVILLFDPVFLR